MVLGLFCLLGSCNPATGLHTSETTEKIQSTMDDRLPELMAEKGVSGLSIAIVRSGEVAIVTGYGTHSKNETKPVRSDTVFEAASLGKPVFTHLFLHHVRTGMLDLDRPLVHYDPRAFKSRHPESDKITARMVLSHTSGLGNLGGIAYHKVSGTPGTSFKYSGQGYAILQKILENETGKSLEELAIQYIFNPLGMNSSSFVLRKDLADHLAKGQNKNGSLAPRMIRSDRGNAAWSLITTAQDYAKFVAHQLSQMHETASIPAQMLEPQIKITKEISWGLGWGLQHTNPNTSFWHWGSNPGYRSYVVGYPVEKTAVIVLSNNENLFDIIEPVIENSIGGELPSYHWF